MGIRPYASGSCLFVIDGHGNWAIIPSAGDGVEFHLTLFVWPLFGFDQGLIGI
jgi:hypothetical protein